MLARASAAVGRYAESYAPAAGPGRPAVIVRLLAALIGVMAITAIMLLCFPELREGPLGRVDPLYARIRLHNIVEIQPLVSLAWLSSGHVGEALQRLIKVIGIALLALPCLAVLLARSSGAAWRFWVTAALALLAFLPLTFYQVRWATYAEAFLVWPYAAGIASLLARFTHPEQPTGVVLRPLLILAALFWPLALGMALPEQKIESAGRACPLDRLAVVLNRAPAPQTLLAYADYGAELLYRTPHSVLSIPNHRLQPGFGATWRILTATDEGAARAELSHFGVDRILLCPSATERALFSVPEAGGPTLYQRLADGQAPSWLRALPLEGDLAAEARLFEVIRPSERTAATTHASQ
jgi:hypothetical protein